MQLTFEEFIGTYASNKTYVTQSHQSLTFTFHFHFIFWFYRTVKQNDLWFINVINDENICRLLCADHSFNQFGKAAFVTILAGNRWRMRAVTRMISHTIRFSLSAVSLSISLWRLLNLSEITYIFQAGFEIGYFRTMNTVWAFWQFRLWNLYFLIYLFSWRRSAL